MHARDAIVDPSLWRDEVVHERVAMTRGIDGLRAARFETDPGVFPLVEEGLVVETRLLRQEDVCRAPRGCLQGRRDRRGRRGSRRGDQAPRPATSPIQPMRQPTATVRP
jgi:hypothetical protein